jgi:hypothetical protein
MSPVNLTSDIWLLTSIFRCLPENKKPPEQKSRRQYNHHQNSPSVSVLDRYKRLVIKKHLVIACYCNISRYGTSPIRSYCLCIISWVISSKQPDFFRITSLKRIQVLAG